MTMRSPIPGLLGATVVLVGLFALALLVIAESFETNMTLRQELESAEKRIEVLEADLAASERMVRR